MYSDTVCENLAQRDIEEPMWAIYILVVAFPKKISVTICECLVVCMRLKTDIPINCDEAILKGCSIVEFSSPHETATIVGPLHDELTFTDRKLLVQPDLDPHSILLLALVGICEEEKRSTVVLSEDETRKLVIE